MKKVSSHVFFVSLFALLFFYYDYPHQLFERPSGPHQWRQTDGASIARNYYYVSMDFFEPRLSIINNNDGKMVSEFPIVYYLAACLYHLFGYHEFILRLLHTLIFFTGLYYLFKTAKQILNDGYYAAICAMLLFTSSILIFYANNFLPDVAALSFTFIGYYYLLRYLESNKGILLLPATLAFTLAGLLKITSLLGFVAIIPVAAYVWFAQKKVHRKPLKQLLPFISFLIGPLLISGLWIAWTKHYNSINNNLYFLSTIKPIWDLQPPQIDHILGIFKYSTLRAFFYREFLNFTPLLALLLFLLPGRHALPLRLWFAALICASACYVLLFFVQLEVHDYYLICLLIIPIALFVLLLQRLSAWKPNLFKSHALRVLAAILFIVCVYHGNRVMREINRTGDLEELMDIESYLAQIGVDVHSKVISYGDYTTGSSLYLMNRRGWTNYGGANSPENLSNLVRQGAKFVIVQPDIPFDVEMMRRFGLGDEIGNYKGVRIYSLAAIK